MNMTRFLFAFLLFSVIACGGDDDEGTGTNCTSTVDQAEVLRRYADIAQQRVSGVVGSGIRITNQANAYMASPTLSTLESLRSDLLLLSESWIFAEPFAYGPDGSFRVSMEINPFPVDESAVDAIIDAGRFDESVPANFDRGIPALDYLLFNGTTADVHQRLAADANARQVLVDLSGAVLDQASTILNAWKDAENSFSTNTGTAAGNGISVLINAFSKHFEDTRRDRLGTPFGVTTLGFANPQTVEAPYSGQSLEWLRSAIEANQSAFLATDPTSTQNLPSLANYLSGLASPDATSLVNDMAIQYQTMLNELDKIDGPLAEAVEQDVDDVQEAYNAISRQVVNLKTDVPAVACVAITYVDNPSDSD